MNYAKNHGHDLHGFVSSIWANIPADDLDHVTCPILAEASGEAVMIYFREPSAPYRHKTLDEDNARTDDCNRLSEGFRPSKLVANCRINDNV